MDAAVIKSAPVYAMLMKVSCKRDCVGVFPLSSSFI